MLFTGKEKKLRDWTESRRKELDNGDVEAVIKAIKKLKPSTEEEKELCEREINFSTRIRRGCGMLNFKRQGIIRWLRCFGSRLPNSYRATT